MIKFLQSLPAFVIVLLATVFEVAGDSIIRKCIYEYTGAARVGLLVAGALLLFLYGSILNLAPFEFKQVVGLYIATLFIVWQVGNYVAFRTFPNPAILIGGAMIVAGGLIVTFYGAEKV